MEWLVTVVGNDVGSGVRCKFGVRSKKTNMRKAIGVAVVLLAMSLVVMAQEGPRPEVAGGYQYTNLNGWHGNGWNGSASINFTRLLGVKGDFSGAYNTGDHFYTYTFGPVVTMRRGAVAPFAEGLFGGASASSGGISNSGMAMMFGGGVDVGRHHVALRIVQADWVITRFNGFTEKNNVRVATGLRYRF